MTILSAVLCVHNEEEILTSCLDKLSFCDEILVLADRCSDNTVNIAKAYNAHVIEGAWPIEGVRKNIGLAEARGEWILEVDADEHVSAELAMEIKEIIKMDAADYYFVPIDNYIGTKLVRNGWGGNIGVRKARRLFKRSAKIWKDDIIHPDFTMIGRDGGTLKHPIRHYVDKNISDMLARLDRYTTAHAAQLRAKGKVPSFARSLIRGLHRGLKSCGSREGYKEGSWGLLLAVMAFLYPVLGALKARLEN